MLLVELVGRQLELTMLHVHPDAQRRGAARALLEALLQRYPDVVAWTDRPQALEALGLVRTGDERDGQVGLRS